MKRWAKVPIGAGAYKMKTYDVRIDDPPRDGKTIETRIPTCETIREYAMSNEILKILYDKVFPEIKARANLYFAFVPEAYIRNDDATYSIIDVFSEFEECDPGTDIWIIVKIRISFFRYKKDQVSERGVRSSTSSMKLVGSVDSVGSTGSPKSTATISGSRGWSGRS